MRQAWAGGQDIAKKVLPWTSLTSKPLTFLKNGNSERRLIQGGIFQSKKDGATSAFLGRIERLDNRLTIDSRSLFMLGDRCGLQLPLEANYSYSDSHDGPDGHLEPLREAYDSALFIVIAPGWHIELFATKLKSEITH